MTTPNPSPDQPTLAYADPRDPEFGNIADKLMASTAESTEWNDTGDVSGSNEAKSPSVWNGEHDATGRTCNVGRTEQKIRLIGGAAMLIAAAAVPVSRKWRLALAGCGAMEIATGATRFCPVWKALGINTAKGDER